MRAKQTAGEAQRAVAITAAATVAEAETPVANMLTSSGLIPQGAPVTAKARKTYRKLAGINRVTLMPGRPSGCVSVLFIYFPYRLAFASQVFYLEITQYCWRLPKTVVLPPEPQTSIRPHTGVMWYSRRETWIDAGHNGFVAPSRFGGDCVGIGHVLPHRVLVCQTLWGYYTYYPIVHTTPTHITLPITSVPKGHHVDLCEGNNR